MKITRNYYTIKKINSLLIKACDYIDKFRSEAEDHMLSKVNPPTDDKRWIKVFYGREEE